MITITPAKLSDVLIINELAHRIWPVAYKNIIEPGQMEYMLDQMYSISALQHEMEVLKCTYILIRDDEKPVGFASYSPKKNNREIYKLYRIYVLPEEQGKGIGKRIIEYIINEIKPLDIKILELNVNRQNEAKYFYEKLGFKVVTEIDIPIGKGYFMNDYIMQKTV